MCLVCLGWIFSESFITDFAASCSVRLQITNCSGSFMASLLAETVTTFLLLDDLTDVAFFFTKRESDLQKERKRKRWKNCFCLCLYCTEEMPETVFRKVLLELEVIQ